MFYVRLKYQDGGYRLGNGEGQGFYRCKRISTVERTLKNIMRTHQIFLKDCSEYEIYSCTENTKYNNNLPLVKVVRVDIWNKNGGVSYGKTQ